MLRFQQIASHSHFGTIDLNKLTYNMYYDISLI